MQTAEICTIKLLLPLNLKRVQLQRALASICCCTDYKQQRPGSQYEYLQWNDCNFQTSSLQTKASVGTLWSFGNRCGGWTMPFFPSCLPSNKCQANILSFRSGQSKPYHIFHLDLDFLYHSSGLTFSQLCLIHASFPHKYWAINDGFISNGVYQISVITNAFSDK